MAKKTNVPEIRFAGFTDPWEQRKLGELGFAQSGIGFPNTEQGGTEGTPFFKVSDMNMSGNEHELVASNNYVTPEQISRMGWHPINQVPAIFFAKVGAAVMLNRKRLVNKPFLMDNNTMAFSMDSSLLNTQFGQLLFDRLDLTSLIQVGALPSYNLSDVESITVSLPSTMDEQRQIGECLCNINDLITLHQRKYDKLCAVKKSMLDKIFPKPGEVEPEIRFAGFTDPWEQRKLGEIAPVTMGQSPNGACYTDNPNDVVLVQGNADLKDGWVSPRVWTTEITKTAKSGDLIMSVRAPVGAMGKTAYDVVLGRGVAGIVGNEFLFQALSKKEAEGYWSTVSAGSTFDSINGDELRSTPIDCPRSETECEAIGNCLSKVDHLITLHQRELNLLKNTKKSLLDKMFV